MKIRYTLLFLFLIIAHLLAKAQDGRIDTFSIEKLSSTIPIVSDRGYLELVIKNNNFSWIFNHSIFTIAFEPQTKSTKRIIYSNINCVSIKGIKANYYEAYGKIRLRDINFKKNRKHWITDGNLFLSRDLTMTEFIKKTGYKTTDFIGPIKGGTQNPILPKHKRCYLTTIYTGEPYGTLIVLYFDKHKKLYFAEFGICNIGECEITTYE